MSSEIHRTSNIDARRAGSRSVRSTVDPPRRIPRRTRSRSTDENNESLMDGRPMERDSPYTDRMSTARTGRSHPPAAALTTRRGLERAGSAQLISGLRALVPSTSRPKLTPHLTSTGPSSSLSLSSDPSSSLCPEASEPSDDPPLASTSSSSPSSSPAGASLSMTAQ